MVEAGTEFVLSRVYHRGDVDVPVRMRLCDVNQTLRDMNAHKKALADSQETAAL